MELKSVGYKSSEWGSLYHSLPYEEALGAGSAGPGKSLVLLMDALAQAHVENERVVQKDHPHRLRKGDSTGWALHLRRTGPMLEQTIARSHRIFPRLDPGAKWNEQKRFWIFTSGYHYQFGHCKDATDWEIYMSNEYSHIAWDELVQFDEEQYDNIILRLRSSDPVLRTMLKVRSMSNPMVKKMSGETFSVKDPTWVRRRFVDPAPKGRVVLKKKIVRQDGTESWHRSIYLPATLFDNPDKQFVEDYEKTLLGAPPHIRQAMLYGDWYITEGSYYGSVWNKQLHICKPFKVPQDWPIFRSMDWGFKNPGCVHWFAMDEDDNLFCVKELTFVEKDPSEVSEMIRAVEEGMGVWKGRRSLITGPADTQLWEQRGDMSFPKVAEFANRGVPWVQASKNRARNAMLIYQRLGDHDGGTTTPGLVFFEDCRNIIRTLPSIQRRDMTDEPVDGGDDHWHDSLGYGCNYAVRGRKGIGRPRADDDESDWEKPKTDSKNLGRYGYGSRVL